MNEPLESQQIERALAIGLRSGQPAPLRIGAELEILEEVGSTNDIVAERAVADAPEGLAVFAERQTAGRGRKAVDWVAPPRLNLTFSVLLRPTIPVDQWSRFAHAAGLAVMWGVAPWTEGRRLQLKWPNDVVCEGRKLAGVLLESRSYRGEAFVVLGVGLNVNSLPDDFPPDLSADVCSVRWLSRGAIADRNALAGSILAELNRAYDRSLTNFADLLPEIARSSCLIHRRVRFHETGDWIEAKVTGFGPNGELAVRRDDSAESHLVLSAEHVRLVAE